MRARAPSLILRTISLLASMAVLTSCDQAPRPAGEGTGPVEPAPSAVAPGGCKKLCARQAKCLIDYHRLGGRGYLVTPLTQVADCPGVCERSARDPLLGVVLSRIIERCSERASCDSFIGCSVRQRLKTVAGNPWMERALQMRRQARAVAKLTRERSYQLALRHCESLKPPPGPNARKKRATRAVRRELVKACTDAIRGRMKALAAQLGTAIEQLTPDAQQGQCRILSRWKKPAWLPLTDSANKTAAQVRGLCVRLASLRQLAYTVRDARRDVATVKAALTSGKADDALYYKCAHKSTAFETLQKATHPTAKRIAGQLREACFERFGVAFLKRHRDAGAGFEERHCYKLKQILTLVTKHARGAVRKKNATLLSWAAQRCP